GDVVADPRLDAGAEAREPPGFLAATAGAQPTAGADENLRASAAVAAREPALPLSGRRRVRALVRAGAPGRAALRQAHAGLDRANPASVPLREGGRTHRAGVRRAAVGHGPLRGRPRRVRDSAPLDPVPGGRDGGGTAGQRLGWRPLSGARARGRRAGVVYGVG